MEGLNYCHKMGIAHRDIKINNCLLDDQSNLLISDFGMADHIAGNNAGWFTKQCGTKDHMSPELFKGDPYQGFVADTFAAAVILF